MDILDSVKNGFTTALDTVSDVTQNIIEKNRATAQLNRLRAVMKSECEMINRAYIMLGKSYYESKSSNKDMNCPNEEELFKIIEDSKANIKKARERYRQVMDYQTVIEEVDFHLEDLEDITVACSNEDEYEKSPFNKEEAIEVEKIEEKSAETNTEVEENDSF